MRLLILADIDDLHWKHGSGQADVLLSCGDVADAVLLEAAQAYGCVAIFAVKGSHDINAPFPAPIVDLHLRVQQHGGMKFGGLNGSWKYKPRGYYLYEQAEVERFLAHFPYVDVFLSHNSPRGIHDRDDEVHVGFEGLRNYVLRKKPRLVIHGHQHLDKETLLGETRIVGVIGSCVMEV